MKMKGADIMFKSFSVENYKNFLDPIKFDFTQVGKYKFNEDCLSQGYLGKALIYGRNGTGKTNLGKAMIDIYKLLFSLRSHPNQEWILNAQSEKETVLFTYEFQYGNDEVKYEYKKDGEDHLLAERLMLNGKEIFALSLKDKRIDANKLVKLGVKKTNVNSYLEALNENEEEFNLSFLRWLMNNTAFSSKSILNQLKSEVWRMKYVRTSELRTRSMKIRYRSLFEQFYKELEDFLNQMGVSCKLKVIEDPLQGEKKLFFDFKKPIPFFENASSGTLALTDFFCRFYSSLQNTSFLFLDEFDAFFHYEMSEKFFQYLKERYPDIQIIFTTHNTDLMSNALLRPDCIFILSTEGKLTSLDHATERELREGHNLEKMYRSGEFAKYE